MPLLKRMSNSSNYPGTSNKPKRRSGLFQVFNTSSKRYLEESTPRTTPEPSQAMSSSPPMSPPQLPKLNTNLSPVEPNSNSNLNQNLSPLNYHNRSRAGTNLSARSGDSANYSFSASPNATSNKRSLSDKVKATPSSLVRQLRIYSSSSPQPNEYEAGALSPNSSSSSVLNSPKLASRPNSRSITPNPLTKSNSLLDQNKLISQNLPPELSPIVNLINAQKLRTYCIGSFKIPSPSSPNDFLDVEAKLTGIELAIWRNSTTNDEFNPKYINLIDVKIDLNGTSSTFNPNPQLRLLQDFTNDSSMTIHFNSNDDYNRWLAAIQLAKFEYTSLNEAFTAVMLSLKGTSLSDIHILLTPKKRFPKFEWCNLRLPQISSKWLKVYCVIFPGDSKHIGRIEMYTTDKILKKNLILCIPQLNSVYNVYPEHYNMIDFNSIMKLNGDIFINKNYEHLFVHSDLGQATPIGRSLSFKSHLRNNSTNSLSSLNQSNGHQRSVSINSTQSFFTSATSGVPNSPKVDESPKKKSIKSSFKLKNLSNFVTTNYLYLMPIPHPGVSAIEIMLRNFIHIIDAFKLYGRPNHLISDKSNIESLLFGLPSLPHFQYLSMDDCYYNVTSSIDVAKRENWNDFDWRNLLKKLLSQKFDEGFARNSKYKGQGNIMKLYQDLEVDSNEINDYETIASPKINLPQDNGQFNLPNNDQNQYSNINSITNDELLNPAHEFDGFSDGGMSPSNSQSNSVGLGDPIEFNRQQALAQHQSSGLEPIADYPTPIDESHPYQNLVNMKIRD